MKHRRRSVRVIGLLLGLAAVAFARWHWVEVDSITFMDANVYTCKAPNGAKIRVVVATPCTWHTRTEDGWLGYTGNGNLVEDEVRLVWESDQNHYCRVEAYNVVPW